MRTLEQLAHHANADMRGDARKELSAVSSLATAGATHIALFDNPAKIKWLRSTNAGAVILRSKYAHECPTNALIVEDPALVISRIETCFESSRAQHGYIHPQALISSTCEFGQNLSVGANSWIGERVVIGDNVSIGAGCVIEPDVCIGRGSVIGHLCVVHQNSIIGHDAQIDGGAIIGAQPFSGVKSGGVWQQGAAFGSVIIEDGVHVGANTVIDRGGFSDTVLGYGVIVDNLVQIAHDTIIGAHTVIAGCAAIGANCIIGEHCVIGGASTIAANVHMADDVIITGMSTVSKIIKKPGVYSSGTMVSEHQSWRKNVARFRQLDKWVDRIKTLEKKTQLWLDKQNQLSE